MRAFVHDDFWTHWKLQRASLRLKMDSTHLGGCIVRLWCWAMRYRPDGSLEGLEDAEIAAAAGLERVEFAETLRAAGFMDAANRLHDWEFWQGALLAKVNRDRARRAEKASKESPRRASAARALRPTAVATAVAVTTSTALKTSSPPVMVLDLFDTFWKAYPRKVGKDEARKAWAKRKPDTTLSAKILAAVAAQKGWPAWADPQYIPHPATWLNRAGWEDEPAVASQSQLPILKRVGPEAPRNHVNVAENVRRALAGEAPLE